LINNLGCEICVFSIERQRMANEDLEACLDMFFREYLFFFSFRQMCSETCDRKTNILVTKSENVFV